MSEIIPRTKTKGSDSPYPSPLSLQRPNLDVAPNQGRATAAPEAPRRPAGTSKWAASVIDFRMHALRRMYERRDLLDFLIESLETYQRMQQPHRAECIQFESLKRCS